MRILLLLVLISFIFVSCSNIFVSRDSSEDWYFERTNINMRKFNSNTAGMVLTISAQDTHTIGDSIFIFIKIKNTSTTSQMLRLKHSYGFKDSTISKSKFSYGYEFESATQRVIFLDIVYPEIRDSSKYLIGVPIIKSIVPNPDDFLMLYPGQEYMEAIQVDDITYHVNRKGSYLMKACYENYLDYPDTLYPIDTWKGKIYSNTINIKID